jgi:hypothetical protein
VSTRIFPDLPAVAQQVIGKHAGDHRLANRHGTDANARVMAALGSNLRLSPKAIHCLPRLQDRGGGLYRKTRNNRLAGRDPAEYPACMI